MLCDFYIVPQAYRPVLLAIPTKELLAKAKQTSSIIRCRHMFATLNNTLTCKPKQKLMSRTDVIINDAKPRLFFCSYIVSAV